MSQYVGDTVLCKSQQMFTLKMIYEGLFQLQNISDTP